MGKHTDALKSFDEFRAPWETADGSEAEIDKGRIKRFIFNLMGDKAKAQDARDEALEAQKVAEAERDEAKTEAANANPADAQKKIEKLEAENAKLKQEAEDRKAADEHEALRKEVIGDLDPKYAKYVTGDDREALEKSLEAVKTDFGLSDDPSEDNEDDDDVLRTRPRTRLQNGGDPKGPRGGELEYDPEKVADEILGAGPFG